LKTSATENKFMKTRVYSEFPNNWGINPNVEEQICALQWSIYHK